ncbi:hypothetical protein [Myxococcus sp. RHSTA-1-4]|uniref:hypothetical protein n=1 Tax=Myxococcus sp. RHSTA-1-4 TaxID=2874601 RepID=UPI001CBBCA13|nr:hypothetical protein [Myxococcus sp. RHSTA-1-4]MBZ4419953.1 hypothetical protein [Myxococcus sp. RHSTA-1-4]
MIRYVMAGLLSVASLVPFTANAQSYPSCRTYCTYGQCGPCSLFTSDTDCFTYNGCGGKYPIPVAPTEEEQASTESMSTSEEVLVCAPRVQDEASSPVQG